MNSNGLLRKHWFHVATHFAADVGLFFLAFVLAAFLRFGDEAEDSLWVHWPYLMLGALTLSSITYITGLYSTHSAAEGVFKRAVVLGACVAFAMLVVVGVTYGSFARPLGRGIMLIGGLTTFVLCLIHHVLLLHALRNTRERVAYIVSSAFDEAEIRLFTEFNVKNLDFAGVILSNGYQPQAETPVLGVIDDLPTIVKQHRVERVLCTSKNLGNSNLTRHFCRLRYSGVTVMPLILLCEEVQQAVPLELVTHEWLLNASGEPHLFYIKKVKRLFDIVCSAVGLVLATPLIILAAIAIKLTSRGPVFYRQERAGRFGRVFRMTKLRTMRVDAEKDGIQWSSPDGRDPRVTWVGKFLRKYRIDEVPQFWHVLVGDLSFVGPRPERPEIIAQLSKEIPFYEERLMVQPGITGWAQVNYPYGASIHDARRKLEYDLYYMKHMGAFLDVFILLDTVRTILTGGVQLTQLRPEATEAIREWERMRAAEAGSARAGDLKLETV